MLSARCANAVAGSPCGLLTIGRPAGRLLITDCAPRSRRIRQPVLRKTGQVLPLVDTRVTFPAGGLTADAEVLAVIEVVGASPGSATSVGIVTDISPFHPVDPFWPDQGADRGVVTFSGCATEVVDVVLGATQGHNLLTATNIPVRRGEPGWAFLVVHVLAPAGPVPAVGQRIRLDVDAVSREALCFGHTACHVAALALNAALASRWRKPVPVDGLGHPDFDQLAVTASRIHPDAATDRYRIGKSLRKKGFDAVELDLGEVAAAADKIMAGWVEHGAAISIVADGPGLTDARRWVCDLADGVVRMPCGGTHLTSLAGVGAIRIELSLTAAELIMQTNVTRR